MRVAEGALTAFQGSFRPSLGKIPGRAQVSRTAPSVGEEQREGESSPYPTLTTGDQVAFLAAVVDLDMSNLFPKLV